MNKKAPDERRQKKEEKNELAGIMSTLAVSYTMRKNGLCSQINIKRTAEHPEAWTKVEAKGN